MGSGTQSKRSKKFNSSGGVKGRLLKGTISNKGSFGRKNPKKNKNGSNANDAAMKLDNASAQYMAEKQQKREEADLLSKKNLGELDMESFFETFAEGIDEDNDDDDNQENAVDKQMMVDDDDSSSDDDDDASKEGKTKSQAKGDSSDSEEEDIEEAERQMKEEMGKIQDKDPEFHQFLKDNEDALLDYADDEDDDDDDDDNDQDPTKIDKKDDAVDSSDSSIRLTSELLDKYEKGAFKSHGIKALKKIVNAYKSACHMTDEEKQIDGRGQNYRFDSSDVFDRLMVLSLTKCKDEFHYHLLGDGSKKEGDEDDTKMKGSKNAKSKKNEDDDDDDDSSQEEDEDFDPDKPINPKILERVDRWNDFSPILFTFFKSTTHILSEAKVSRF
jgi:hypothetical protein